MRSLFFAALLAFAQAEEIIITVPNATTFTGPSVAIEPNGARLTLKGATGVRIAAGAPRDHQSAGHDGDRGSHDGHDHHDHDHDHDRILQDRDRSGGPGDRMGGADDRTGSRGLLVYMQFILDYTENLPEADGAFAGADITFPDGTTSQTVKIRASGSGSGDSYAQTMAIATVATSADASAANNASIGGSTAVVGQDVDVTAASVDPVFTISRVGSSATAIGINVRVDQEQTILPLTAGNTYSAKATCFIGQSTSAETDISIVFAEAADSAAALATYSAAFLLALTALAF